MPKSWVRTLPAASRFILHGDVGARTAASAVWGLGFSEIPCRSIAHAGRATLWLGPNEHLLWDGQRHTDNALATELEQALRDIPHALVDISHRQIAMEITGPHAESIINGGCPLDLDIGQFPVGMCTRSVFAKADIVLWRTQAETFHLEIWRSFEAYVSGLLAEIGREYYGVQ